MSCTTGEAFDVPWLCPDGGPCDHECELSICARVLVARPRAGVFPENQWPPEIVTRYGADGQGREPAA
jgi:hypothetical protein